MSKEISDRVVEVFFPPRVRITLVKVPKIKQRVLIDPGLVKLRPRVKNWVLEFTRVEGFFIQRSDMAY
jgi:hypothetical protein